ncbi:MAG TPA: hypothetical protein VGT98_00240 [Candidatus Elarobacter sp.]|nr:hypothetical protein [Candidatus Elarobacter sp.]
MTSPILTNRLRDRVVASAPLWTLCLTLAACVRITPVTPSTPAPAAPPSGTSVPSPVASAPVVPPPATPAVRTGSWQFAFAPGGYSYSVVTDARITPVTDRAQGLVPPELVQHATISISPSGAVQVTDPTTATTSTAPCDPTATLISRMQSLVPRLPARLVAGDTWTDSTTTTGCAGAFLATSHVMRRYTVIGDTTFAGIPAIQIHRADDITASSEGSNGQHRVLIAATGTGGGELFFDPAGGRFLGTIGTQHTTVDVTTSGRTTRFVQEITERVTIAP